MISVSVRDKLQLVGQSASLKQLAHESGKQFPVRLRSWVGAPPPGRIVRKAIPLDSLESRFNEFFNSGSTPLFKLRLHGTQFGQSDLTVFSHKPNVGYEPIFVKDMGHLEFDLPLAPNPNFHFSNLESERISVVGLVFAERLGIQIRMDFETEHEEIKVNNFPNLNFTELNITLTLQFDSSNGAIDLLKWIDGVNNANEAADFIKTHVLVAAHTLPDGLVRNRTRRAINEKLFQALKEESVVRDLLKVKVTSSLLGNTFHVVSVDSDGQSLLIDYVLPPGQPEPT